MVLAAMVGIDSGAVWADEPDPWSDAIRAAIGEGGVRVSEEKIGRSIEGRPLTAYRVHGGPNGQARATVVVIAGLDGRHTAGTRIAIGIMKEVLVAGVDATARADLVIIPCANPDGMARFMSRRPRTDDGTNAASRVTSREDDDRDRRIDEDAPSDLDGDGVIAQMRVKRPRAGLVPGLVATEVPEADDARLTRRADAAKGELGEYALLPEGSDVDGDGLVAEDGPRGVELDANFPYHWPEYRGEAGPAPLSEPESRAIAEWLLAHPEVVAIVEFAPNDNLVRVPEAGKMDSTGQAPISGAVLDDDKPLYEWASNAFKEATAITGVGGVTRSFDGSLQGWTYAQLGVAAFVTPGWVRPDLCKRDEPKGEGENAERPAGDKAATSDKKVPDTEDGKWLALSDARVAAGLPAGFLDWKPFEHPQLGPVEIGGWVPGFKLDVPEVGLARAKVDQAAFIRRLLAAAPVLEAATPRVERLGERVWKIGVSATNTGTMATRTAMGVRCRRLPPTRWEIDVPPERLIAGRKSQAEASIAPGGQISAEWIVTGEPGSAVPIRLLSPETGDRAVDVKLEPEADGTGGGR